MDTLHAIPLGPGERSHPNDPETTEPALPSTDVYEFDNDTAVTWVETSGVTSVWTAELSAGWNIGANPNGGYVLAVAGRAIGATRPQHPHPLSVTAHYLRPAQPGPATITVEMARTGRKHSTASATFVQNSKERIRVLATFGDLSAQEGPTRVEAEAPQIPAMDRCISRGSLSDDGSTIAGRVNALLDPRLGWTQGTPGGTAALTGWISFKDDRPADPLSLLFFADAFPPALFDWLPEKVWLPTIELTVHVRGKPAPGPLRGVTRTRFLMDGYLEEDGELWDSSNRMVAQSRQLGMVFRP